MAEAKSALDDEASIPFWQATELAILALGGCLIHQRHSCLRQPIADLGSVIPCATAKLFVPIERCLNAVIKEV